MASGSAEPKQFVALLDCPICTDFMHPPIYQCPSGHVLCSKCKKSIDGRCPSCRKEMGDIRCLLAEKMAETLKFPCKYHNKGCKGSFTYESKRKHEEECCHRPFKCPYTCFPACDANGDAQMLILHMNDAHGGVDIITENEFEFRYQFFQGYDSIEADRSKVKVFNCFNEYFCLWSCVLPTFKDMTILIYLIFVGESIDAEKFRYKVELGETGSKITYEGVPVDIREDKKRIDATLRGLVFNYLALSHFTSSDPKTCLLTIEIWEV